MRWPVFIVFAFVCCALEISVRNTLRLDALYGVSPSFVACLATFIALFAHRLSALWACWILGVLMDLMPRGGPSTVFPIGPNALGFVVAGYVIILLRTMVFRRRVLTIGAMTFIFLISASIVSVALLIVRSWYPPVNPDMPPEPYFAMRDLAWRAMVALYSGVLAAVPVGWALLMTTTLWGFGAASSRRGG
jgi:cell shape-determining protein MreD